MFFRRFQRQPRRKMNQTISAQLVSVEQLEDRRVLAASVLQQLPALTLDGDAADLTLSMSDQKLAASFFDDPHRAQEIRQSDSRRHERFWERYESFGQTAENFCGR